MRPEYLMSRASGSTHTIRILVVSDILMDTREGINSKEFSIEQGVIYTQTEPELGEYGDRRLENARIRGVVNLGLARVGGGFELAKTLLAKFQKNGMMNEALVQRVFFLGIGWGKSLRYISRNSTLTAPPLLQPHRVS